MRMPTRLSVTLAVLSLVGPAFAQPARPVRERLNNSAQFQALRGRDDTGRGSARDALASGGLSSLRTQDLTQLAPNAPAPPTIRRASAASPSLGAFGASPVTTTVPSTSADGGVGGAGTVDRERVPSNPMRGLPGAATAYADPHGTFGVADVARLLRQQKPRLRACYDAARVTRPRLAGRASVGLVVLPTGELSDVEVTGFPEAPEVAPCMAAALRRVRLPRPEGTAMPFRYATNFSPPAVTTHSGSSVVPSQSHTGTNSTPHSVTGTTHDRSGPHDRRTGPSSSGPTRWRLQS